MNLPIRPAALIVAVGGTIALAALTVGTILSSQQTAAPDTHAKRPQSAPTESVGDSLSDTVGSVGSTVGDLVDGLPVVGTPAPTDTPMPAPTNATTP
ncbi:hypothetical protein ACGFNU_01615 [Spirillospora sp. NPDC048911]|uniref:hypothetical protein n=1 Tax=Spirillospora sp. NPDC048911 TaxID=3364527 RepID=UPI0037121595